MWNLSKTLTKERDSLFVLEMLEKEGDRRRIVPVFERREDAEGLKGKLCGDQAGAHSAQTMRLSEVGQFAAKNDLEIMLLDARGTILAHLEAKLEQVAVH